MDVRCLYNWAFMTQSGPYLARDSSMLSHDARTWGLECQKMISIRTAGLCGSATTVLAGRPLKRCERSSQREEPSRRSMTIPMSPAA